MGAAPQILYRSGRAGGWLVLILALLALVAWAVMQSPGPETAAEGLNPDRVPSPQAESGVKLGDLDSASPAATRNNGSSIRGATPQFLGRGSIRGLLTTPDGSPPPMPFTVHVGPSNSLGGREFAAPNSAEFSAAEFALVDIPLGGYDVWIDAPGMNSRRTPVLLTQAAQHPFVVIQVSPMGYLDGFVMTHDGRPAQDLRVELAEMFGEDRQITSTRPDGFYIFDQVPDGEYRILFGPLHRPLVPVRELAFKAPKMHFPKLELPTTVDVLVKSTDRMGKPLAEVTISGFGKPGGRMEVTTDQLGRGWARNLPPGTYRVIGEHADGRSAKMTFIVKDEPGQEFNIAPR